MMMLTTGCMVCVILFNVVFLRMQFEGAGNGVMVGDVLRMFGGIAMNAE